jgi:hypothetical protein
MLAVLLAMTAINVDFPNYDRFKMEKPQKEAFSFCRAEVEK